MDPAMPARQRAQGRIAVEVRSVAGAAVIGRVSESGSARVRFPTVRDGTPEAVLVNTAGGIASGDSFEVGIAVAAGARLVVTTAAAERVYRSDGATARISTAVTVGPGARLDWLPQETILFDRARLERRLEVEVDPGGSVFLFDATVFGRAARGEQVREGLFHDRWRLRRGGRLVHADSFRLEGPVADLLARPTVAAGRVALATALYAAPDAEARLEETREALAGSVSECGASAWDGRLLVRWLAPDVGTLRRDAARFMRSFRGRDLPRVWHL